MPLPKKPMMLKPVPVQHQEPIDKLVSPWTAFIAALAKRNVVFENVALATDRVGLLASLGFVDPFQRAAIETEWTVRIGSLEDVLADNNNNRSHQDDAVTVAADLEGERTPRQDVVGEAELFITTSDVITPQKYSTNSHRHAAASAFFDERDDMLSLNENIPSAMSFKQHERNVQAKLDRRNHVFDDSSLDSLEAFHANDKQFVAAVVNDLAMAMMGLDSVFLRRSGNRATPHTVQSTSLNHSVLSSTGAVAEGDGFRSSSVASSASSTLGVGSRILGGANHLLHSPSALAAAEAEANANSTGYHISSSCPKSCVPLYERVLRPATHLLQINEAISEMRVEESNSRVLDAFANAAQEELQYILEEVDDFTASEFSSLHAVQVALTPIQHAIAELHVMVCEEAFGVGAAQLLTKLYQLGCDAPPPSPDEKMMHGARKRRETTPQETPPTTTRAANPQRARLGYTMAQRLLQGTMTPVCITLAQWMCNGVLDDPCSEFFVGLNKSTISLASLAADNKIYVAGSPYVCHLNRCPSFLRDVAADILRVGAYLSMLSGNDEFNHQSRFSHSRSTNTEDVWKLAFTRSGDKTHHHSHHHLESYNASGIGLDLMWGVLEQRLTHRFVPKVKELLQQCSSAVMARVLTSNGDTTKQSDASPNQRRPTVNNELFAHFKMMELVLLGADGVWDSFFTNYFDAVCVGGLSSDTIDKYVARHLQEKRERHDNMTCAMTHTVNSNQHDDDLLEAAIEDEVNRTRDEQMRIIQLEWQRAKRKRKQEDLALELRDQGVHGLLSGGRVISTVVENVVRESVFFFAEQTVYNSSTITCKYLPPAHLALVISPDATKRLTQIFKTMNRLRWVRCFLVARQREAFLAHRADLSINPSLIHLMSTACAVAGQLLNYWAIQIPQAMRELRNGFGLFDVTSPSQINNEGSNPVVAGDKTLSQSTTQERRGTKPRSVDPLAALAGKEHRRPYMPPPLTVEESCSIVNTFTETLVRTCFLSTVVNDSPVTNLVNALEFFSVNTTPEGESQLVSAMRRCSAIGHQLGQKDFGLMLDMGNHYNILVEDFH